MLEQPYRTTPIEQVLETRLTFHGTILGPARSVLDDNYPPEPEMPIITREMLGHLSGIYQRRLWTTPPLPLSTIDEVRCLEGYHGVLTEHIVIWDEPQAWILARYQDGSSMVEDAGFDHELREDELQVFRALWNPLPAVDSIGMLATADPERFIASLGAIYEYNRGTKDRCPNAYNTTF